MSVSVSILPVRHHAGVPERSPSGLPIGIAAAVAWIVVAIVVTFLVGLARFVFLGARPHGALTWE